MCDGKREMTRQEVIDLQNKLTNECEKLRAENKHLRELLKEAESYCGFGDDDLPFSDEEDSRLAGWVEVLHRQRQQDCATINRLHATIDTLVKLYADLMENAGMD